MRAVLVSCGCHDKLLKTTAIYPLPVLKARSSKSRCWQGRALSSSRRGRNLLRLSSFYRLPGILGIPWLAKCIAQSLPPSPPAIFPMSLSCPNFPLLIRTPVRRDLILTGSHLLRPYFQVRSHSQVDKNFGRTPLNPKQGQLPRDTVVSPKVYSPLQLHTGARLFSSQLAIKN